MEEFKLQKEKLEIEKANLEVELKEAKYMIDKYNYVEFKLMHCLTNFPCVVLQQ